MGKESKQLPQHVATIVRLDYLPIGWSFGIGSKCLNAISYLCEARSLKLIGLTPAQEKSRLFETFFSNLQLLIVKDSILTSRFLEWHGQSHNSKLFIENCKGLESRVSDDSRPNRSLREISVKDSQVRNAWFSILHGCNELEQLVVENDPSFDDKCIQQLEHNVALKVLSVKHCCSFTGASLGKIEGGLPERLWLNGNNHDANLLTKILASSDVRDVVFHGGTQDSVILSSKSSNLSRLSLSIFLKDGNYQFLGTLVSLENLFLDECNIDHGTISSLRPLSQLSYLSCRNTNMTDEYVPLLMQLDGLDELDVSGTKISTNGVATLRAKFPNTQIVASHLEERTMSKPDLDN